MLFLAMFSLCFFSDYFTFLWLVILTQSFLLIFAIAAVAAKDLIFRFSTYR